MPRRVQYAKSTVDSDKKRTIYKPLKYPEIPSSLDDIYIVTSIGDRLDTLANKFYNDSDLWWIIANANPDVVRRDSYSLKSFLQIRIPMNTSEILENFENLNKE